MFHAFNQMTQSLRHATHEISMGQSLMSPVSLKAAQPKEIQHEYNSTSSSPKEGAAIKHQAKGTKGYPVPNTSKYRKIMDMQSRFLLEDGKLVWQKLPKDMPLYYTTVALVVVGFGLTVYSIKQLATPPKNN